jgi:hypothetical protein
MSRGETDTRATTIPFGGAFEKSRRTKSQGELVHAVADPGEVRPDARHVLRLHDDLTGRFGRLLVRGSLVAHLLPPLASRGGVPHTCRKRNSTDRYGLIPVWPVLLP